MHVRKFLFSVMTFVAIVCHGQKAPRKDMISMDSLFHSMAHSQPLPTHRWILSFNPLSLLEWPTAVGMGVGYRVSSHVELWSESSFLFQRAIREKGPLTGIKQILQGKYFPSRNGSFFMGLEVRYKSYQFRDTNVFINPARHDTLFGFSNFSRHYFWGGALQMGMRFTADKGGRFLVEFMAGLGVRKWHDVRRDVPAGYEFVDYGTPIDINIHYLEYQIDQVYFPGSIRVIWLFGKRLRP